MATGGKKPGKGHSKRNVWKSLLGPRSLSPIQHLKMRLWRGYHTELTERFGWSIEVTDTNPISDSENIKQIGRVIEQKKPGFNAIGFIVSPQQLEQQLEVDESLGTLNYIINSFKDYFGKGYNERVFIVLTKAKNDINQQSLKLYMTKLNLESNTGHILHIDEAISDTELETKIFPAIGEVTKYDLELKRALRILLIGPTGAGKSETANSLIGREVFKASKSPSSVTQKSRMEGGYMYGRYVEVVDTPGINDTNHGDEHIYREIARAVALVIPGFHAIAFVLKPKRFTEEMVKTVELFFKYFGGDADDFAVIILTGTEDEAMKTEYMSETRMSPVLSQLVKRCKGRITIIENKPNPKDKAIYANQILEAIDTMCTKRTTPYFTNRMFEEIARKADAYERAQGVFVYFFELFKERVNEDDEDEDNSLIRTVLYFVVEDITELFEEL